MWWLNSTGPKPFTTSWSCDLKLSCQISSVNKVAAVNFLAMFPCNIMVCGHTCHAKALPDPSLTGAIWDTSTTQKQLLHLAQPLVWAQLSRCNSSSASSLTIVCNASGLLMIFFRAGSIAAICCTKGFLWQLLSVYLSKKITFEKIQRTQENRLKKGQFTHSQSSSAPLACPSSCEQACGSSLAQAAFRS